MDGCQVDFSEQGWILVSSSGLDSDFLEQVASTNIWQILLAEYQPENTDIKENQIPIQMKNKVQFQNFTMN